MSEWLLLFLLPLGAVAFADLFQHEEEDKDNSAPRPEPEPQTDGTTLRPDEGHWNGWPDWDLNSPGAVPPSVVLARGGEDADEFISRSRFRHADRRGRRGQFGQQ